MQGPVWQSAIQDSNIAIADVLDAALKKRLMKSCPLQTSISISCLCLELLNGGSGWRKCLAALLCSLGIALDSWLSAHAKADDKVSSRKRRYSELSAVDISRERASSL
eukprot:2336827-Amphidinium_carterae.1